MRAIALAGLLLVAGTAWAGDETGAYGGASLGASSYTVSCDLAGARGCTRNDGTLRLFVGYAFNRDLALEAGLSELAVTASTPTFDLSAVGSLPLNDRSAVYARLGAFTAQSGGYKMQAHN